MNINIAARRIFNKLSEDISDRRGIGDEWDQISPNVKSVEIRREWEQIFTEEIEKHTAELQSKVSDLEEANRSNRIVMSALQNAHEMEKARVKRLEEALVAADKYIDEIQADDNGDYHTWVVNVADARTAYNFAKQAAKESKP